MLALLAGLFGLARNLFVAPVDGAAKQREYFGAGALPFGLALAAAARLPTGDVVVRFAGPAEGAGPAEVLFVEYLGRSAVEPLFHAPPADTDPAARRAEWERNRSFEWSLARAQGEVAWGDASTRYRIDREYPKGGPWRERARVDLSSAARALVLFAEWPPEREIGAAELRALLAHVAGPP